jgi:hypothetical protein
VNHDFAGTERRTIGPSHFLPHVIAVLLWSGAFEQEYQQRVRILLNDTDLFASLVDRTLYAYVCSTDCLVFKNLDRLFTRSS